MIEILLTIVVVGFILWLVTTYVPMGAPIKQIFTAVIVLILILWLLRALGLVNAF